jgi:hypothetical protein
VRDAEAALPAVAVLLGALERAQPSGAAGAPDGAEPEAGALAARAAELRLRYRVLRAQLLLAAGRTGELQAAGAGRRPAGVGRASLLGLG